MPELTRVERDRLDALKAKTPHPSEIPLADGVRTEGEAIEHRRLAERFAGEERLAELRKQDVRSPEDLAEMRTLGATDDEIMAEERARIVAETKARAKDAPAEERAAVRNTRPLQDKERSGHGHEQADSINRAREVEAFDERGRVEDEAKAAQAGADKDAGPAATQRANSDRIARDVEGVQERERMAREPVEVPADARLVSLRAMTNRTPKQDEELLALEGKPAPDGHPPAETVTGSLANQAAAKVRADRLVALRAMLKRTSAQDAEMAGLEGSAG